MVLSFCHFYLSVQHCYYLTKALWVFFYLCSLHRNRIMGKILLELKFQVTRKTNRPTSTSWFKHWRFIETYLSCHCSSMKKKKSKSRSYFHSLVIGMKHSIDKYFIHICLVSMGARSKSVETLGCVICLFRLQVKTIRFKSIKLYLRVSLFTWFH